MLEPLDADDPERLGPYTLDGRLGPSVYLGHDADATAAVVRVVDTGLLAALGRVRGPNVPAVLGSDASAAPPWVATESVEGPTLAEVAGEHGALAAAEVRELTAAVARALTAIHTAGLGHGALSPDTVVMTSGGPVVTGFGTGDQADDVPALGRLIAFAATGREAGPEDVPEAFRETVRRCLAEDPARRPTLTELARPAPGGGNPLAYEGVRPPANPHDLSAGMPADAVAGPLSAAGEGQGADPLAYAATEPPDNPLDLSAGIPSDAIVGPIDADAEPDQPEPITYPATNPPDNPLDLSAGIPGDAIVGPIDTFVGPSDAGAVEAVTPASEPASAPADTTERTIAPVPVAVPVVDLADLAELRAQADAVAAGTPGGAPGHVIEPVAYADPRKESKRRRPDPPGSQRRRRRLLLAGLAAALLIAAAATVPLVKDDDATAGSPPQPTTTLSETDTPPPTGATCDGTKQLTAGGSALQRDAIATIADRWAARCKDSVLDYSPGGTAFGVQQFASGEADFAVVDHVLGSDEGEIAAAAARCAGVGAPADKNLVVQVPIVLTPLVVVYHLSGADELKLDAPTLTAIFSGRVTKWNDRAVARLNPGVRLPATAIEVAVRKDRALTTQTFQEYLTVAGGWRGGDGPEFTGKATSTHISDSDLLALIRDRDGAIGFVPATLARVTDEPVVSLVTAGGRSAQPDSGAIYAAVELATAGIDDYRKLPDTIYRTGTEIVGDGSAPYPLVHVGFVAACTRYADERVAAAIRDFLLTALGTQVASASGYLLPFGDLRAGLADLVERTY